MAAVKKDLSVSKVYYWDSSALIKRYLIEEGSKAIAELFLQQSVLHCTSVITHAEILATFHRVRREGKLSKVNLQKLQQSFSADWSRLSIFPYSSEAQNKALAIIQEVSLKGADLVHLATLETVADLLENPVLITFDQQLINAGKDRGLKIMEFQL